MSAANDKNATSRATPRSLGEGAEDGQESPRRQRTGTVTIDNETPGDRSGPGLIDFSSLQPTSADPLAADDAIADWDPPLTTSEDGRTSSSEMTAAGEREVADATPDDGAGEERRTANDTLELPPDEHEPRDPYVGTTFGDRYLIDERIGEGGMGLVYLAHHKVIERKVAIKVLHAELARDKEAVGRFLREAKAATSIGNPHIVDVLDFGEAPDGATYFVMEYVGGVPLADLLEREGRLSPELVCELVLQICDGLAAAHDQRIIHRDLKPDNVLVKPSANGGSFCKILDFGIAKVSNAVDNDKLTQQGAVFGTPHYMSPEQASGATVDHRADIYSLGVMMYEMLTGEMPFHADNFMGILTQHMYKPPPAFRGLSSPPSCPPGLEAIVLKCLSKKPEARYQSMGELASDVRNLLRTGQSEAARELIGRGDSFSTPASYFSDPAAPSSAFPEDDPSVESLMPRRRSTGKALAMVAALLGLAAFAVYLFSSGMPQTGATVEAPAATATAVAAPDTQPSAAPTSAQVLVYADPTEAYAIVRGKRLKLPDTISVPAGETVQVRVEAGAGYVPKTVDVDGTQEKVKVALERRLMQRPPPARRRPQPPPTVKSNDKSGGLPGYVDPWK